MKLCRACGAIKPLSAFYKKKRNSGRHGSLPDCKECHLAMLRSKYVKRPPHKSDIAPLLPYLNEPYRKEAVLAAARKLQQPFVLREIVKASALPVHVVHRVLGRLVRQGVLTRFKVLATYGGGAKFRVWAYMFVEGK